MSTEFGDKIDYILRKYATKNAIIYMRDGGIIERYTFAEIKSFIYKTLDLFDKIGLKKGDRAAIIAPHSPYAVLICLAIDYAGITAVLLDASLPKEDINKLLEFSDSKCIFTTREIFDIIHEGTKLSVPCYEIADEYKILHFTESPQNCFGLKSTTDPDEDVAAIIFSSGTTGEMKGVEITFSSLIYAHEYMIKYTNLSSSASFLDVLPVNHIAGFSAVISCLLSGAEVGFISDMNSASLAAGFLNYNPTNFIMIPKIYEVIMNKIITEIDKKSMLIKLYAKTVMTISRYVIKYTGIKLRFLTRPIWQAALGKNMKICGCGTAPCSSEIMRFYLDLGIDFVNVYGSTETGFPITAANCNEKYPDCGAGHVNQFPEIKIMIANPDEKGIGEIRVKTPLIMKGYFKEPELTKAAFVDGYFRTGDYGYIDKKGYLHLTGRIKESIVLKNGKKISPSDVDKYYLLKTRNLELASRGIPNKENYDEIHIFVENKDYSVENMADIKAELQSISVSAPSMYKLENVHFIESIPKTSIGKIKRFCLDPNDEIIFDDIGSINSSESSKDKLLNIIKTHTNREEISLSSDLKSDLGIDSLGMFEMIVKIESEYKVDLSPYLGNIQTVEDLSDCVFNHSSQSNKANATFSVSEFPMSKSKHDLALLRSMMKLSKTIWDFKIKGIENIPTDRNYILCPNHESHLDGLWIFTAIGETKLNLRKICCMAKKEHLDNVFSRKWLKLLGGIPVDRYINPFDSIKRCIECVNEGNILLIHPEGTRTRSGDLGEFKEGSAKIALETNCLIVPVCINGAREIYPPNIKLPKIFNLHNMKKYTLEVELGEPIESKGKTAKEITNEINNFIVKSKIRYTEEFK